MSFYNRSTELRNVHAKDLYNLAVILDDDNYWQTLMEVIPLEINNHTFGTQEDLERISSGAAYERKYSSDHIRLIENAVRRPGESRLYSQILFDEWGSSGRKHERPTLGVLFHLLVQSKLYRAADFVAELLKEPKPSRPTNGPAAEFEFDLDVFNDIQDIVNNTSFYPNTEDLQANVNIDINKDHYTKYHKTADKKMPTIIDNIEDPVMTTAPKPPPRVPKSTRLLKQQQKQQNQLLQHTAGNKSSKNVEGDTEQQLKIWPNNESISAQYMPNLSALMDTGNSETITAPLTNDSIVSSNMLPNLSALKNISDNISRSPQEVADYSLNSTPSLIYTNPNITEDYESQDPDINSIPIVVLSKFLNTDSKREELNSSSTLEKHNLPILSELNLNGERDGVVKSAEQYQPSYFENMHTDSMNFVAHQRGSFDEHAVTDDDLPSVITYMNENQTQSRHQLESIEEDYNGIEHEHDNNIEAELEDDEDSLPNLSFLDNRSSNNESSLTSVTNTSGDNSFEQSANDCSSTSTDNVPNLSVFNQ